MIYFIMQSRNRFGASQISSDGDKAMRQWNWNLIYSCRAFALDLLDCDSEMTRKRAFKASLWWKHQNFSSSLIAFPNRVSLSGLREHSKTKTILSCNVKLKRIIIKSQSQTLSEQSWSFEQIKSVTKLKVKRRKEQQKWARETRSKIKHSIRAKEKNQKEKKWEKIMRTTFTCCAFDTLFGLHNATAGFGVCARGDGDG